MVNRNRDLFFGRWCFDVLGAFELVPFLIYAALKSGLSPASFKLIGQEMVEERAAVHQLLCDQLAELGQAVGSQTLRRDVMDRAILPGGGR